MTAQELVKLSYPSAKARTFGEEGEKKWGIFMGSAIKPVATGITSVKAWTNAKNKIKNGRL